MAHSSEDGPTPRNMWAAPNGLNGLFKKKEEEKDKKLERVRRYGVIWEEAGREMGGIMTKLYASLKFSKN